MKKLRTGIIGQGRSGCDIHAHLLELLPNKFTIAAVADPLEDRRKEAEERFGCTSFTDFREMVSSTKLDLVVNASPSYLHVPITAELLDGGYNVLCEKPLARRAAEVDDLTARAAASGAHLAVYQQSRFAPYFLKVRKIVDSGILGRIVMIRITFNGFARRWDWQTLQKFNGGNLLNTGPHPLDQALQLFGTAEEPEIFCLMDRANTFGDAEDHVKLILSGKNSPTIDLEISSCSAYPSPTYTVYGTRGGLQGTTSHLEWKCYNQVEAPEQKLIEDPLPDKQYCTEELKWHEGVWDIPAEEADLFDTMGLQYYNDLYGVLTEGKEPVVKVEEVRRQIEVIEECHRQNPLPVS
ncbi:MAG: Gfo/Idh/MocA family oxidoreductase [Spirochaetales bacterium]|nr:Gfo/Idh/MocA family oxidoreductase [Spirochaetales bacterium]